MIRDLAVRVARRIAFALILVCVLAAIAAGVLVYLQHAGYLPHAWSDVKDAIVTQWHDGIKGLGKLAGSALTAIFLGWLALTFLDELMGGPNQPYDPNRPPNPNNRNDPRNTWRR